MDQHINPFSKRVIETFIIIVLMAVLLDAFYKVFSVFFGILAFALIFSVSFEKPYEQLCKKLNQRRKIVAFIYVVILISIIAVPLIYLFASLIHRAKELVVFAGNISKNGVPPLPDWAIKLPVVGDPIHTFWEQIRSDPKAQLSAHSEQITNLIHHLLSKGMGILGVTIQILAGIFISAIFLVRGQKLVQPLRVSLQYLFGKEEGLQLLNASTQAIKGVSVGVMGTAFIAAIFSWIGLEIGGIPIAIGLSALIFFLVVIQAGPLPVWIPLIIYTISKGYTGLTIFFIIWGVALMVIDSVLKPILIGRSGGKIPTLALFIGVVGGLAAWGFTGMFKGAIIMALAYTIFTMWLKGKSLKTEG